MLMEEERKKIVAYGKQLKSSELTNGTSGNLSILDRTKGLVAISPSGINYDEVKPEDVVITNLNGEIVDGHRKPSSELDLHLSIYQADAEAASIVHTHSMYCTVFASLHIPLQAVHYLIANTASDHVPVVDYETYGSKELAVKVSQLMAENHAVLMANHGMICDGDSMEAAMNIAQTCEWIAELQWRCLCVGKPYILSEEQIDEVIEKFQSYGQKDADDKGSKGYTA